MQLKSYHIKITGIVQGVGFRPHVYRLALEHSLKGWVLNASTGVYIQAEGNEANLKEFARRLVEEPPPLALIRTCEINEMEPVGFTEFIIRESEEEAAKTTMISPDIAICEDCKREVLDPRDRRFGYPFTNCTNCGPRFTIIKDVPYDRVQTTMAEFPMCSDCQQEYDDPRHRRFHAQPNACPVCGPGVTLVDAQGKKVDKSAVDLLREGHILAVKGLGAFHLACDATRTQTVKLLRDRKRRDVKPFAVMARDPECAARYAEISELEQRWLTSPQAPIVILKVKQPEILSATVIHPGLDTLGIMLPYTPLHYLLFDEGLDLLVMTSANISDEPLITDNQEALDKLGGIADYFLMHNREIYNPCDDSVMRVSSLGTPQLFRRARGFVPRGVPLPDKKTFSVLALGGEMKNTFCLTREGEAYLSQHWGDLNHYRNYRNYLEGIERFKKMLDVNPQVIAHDLHPDYQTTRLAREMSDIPRIAVQHHYAHLAAVMAENGLKEKVLGLVCDGTGWGSDGAVWGCEILQGDYHGFERLGHLQYLPYPGGDLNARKPYRMAMVYLLAALGESGVDAARQYLPNLSDEERQILMQSLSGKMGQGLQTSSCGRLFDAVAAFLGICQVNRYEGQAAAELEAQVDANCPGHYNYGVEWDREGQLIMNILPMWEELLTERCQGVPGEKMAARFHRTLTMMFADALLMAAKKTGGRQVALSGGVFHNQVLLYWLSTELKRRGFKVYHHQMVPPGDGGISLGQAVIASEVDL